MYENRSGKSQELFVATNALYKTLFNLQTCPPNLSNAVHVDSMVGESGKGNIVATFDFVNLIGWRYNENQPKPKKRGTAEFSLKKVVTEMNEEAETSEETIKYGVIVEDADG